MPIETPQGTLDVENAKLRASEIIATASVGIGTTESNQAYPLQIFKETGPDIRIQEGATSSSASRLYSNNSNLYIQTGTNFTTGSSGDIAFQTMGGQSTHMIVKSDGKVGVGTNDPTGPLQIYGNSANYFSFSPAEPDDTSVLDNTNFGATSMKKQMTMRMNSRNWYWGIINDTSNNLGLGADGGGGNDPDVQCIFQNNGTFWAKHIHTSGNVGIGQANPTSKLHVSGGVSYFPDGISTPGYHAQWALSGGGNVSWDGSNLLWSHRIIAIPVEKNEFSSVGYIDINCPTSGTITYYKHDGTTGTATCASSGVPISSWEALWYVVTPGQSQTSDQTKFVLTAYGNSDWRPDSNWLLIALKNGDSQSNYPLKFMPTNSTHYTWIAPTFLNSWTNYDSAWTQAGFYKDANNVVHLRGLVKDGTINKDIFVLPVGYRPSKTHLLNQESDAGSSRLDINNNGGVRPRNGSSSWFSLDGISFTAN